MSLTVILAVGLDSSLPGDQSPAWKSAGYLVTTAPSIKEAIVQLQDGDFDLVLLGQSISIESRERLSFLLRGYGSRIPIFCLTDSCSVCDVLPDTTSDSQANNILRRIEELLADSSNVPASRAAVRSAATPEAASNG